MAEACVHLAQSPLCCACARASVFVLFSMLSDMRLTDSVQSADRARCVIISPASLGDVFGLCVRVCAHAGRGKVFDPSYLQHPGVFVFTAKAQPQCCRHMTQGGILHINHTHTHSDTHTGYQPSAHCMEQIINTWYYPFHNPERCYPFLLNCFPSVTKSTKQ